MQFEAFRPQGEASRQCNIIYIVPLQPAYKAGLSGYIPVRFQILDSYMLKSESFLPIFHAPSPFPSPRWGEGGGEGKISNIFG